MKSTMEGAGGSSEDLGAPESWEAADVEESMKRLLLSSTSPAAELDLDTSVSDSGNPAAAPSDGASEKTLSLSEEAINQVDQFLREALQNPRERLSILRMEQDVAKFVQDPTQYQMEFQELPTSYLRLAAHRVAQHYFLQSMILVDESFPEGNVIKIIVRKTSGECRFPRIRLADIPVNRPKEEGGVVKLAIKQRPQKHSHAGNSCSSSETTNQSKSVEERKEEYNRARARIFNSSAHASTSSTKPDNETRRSDNLSHASVSSTGKPQFVEECVSGGADISTSRVVVDTSSTSSRAARTRTEKDSVARYKPDNSRVAIFRDREVESKDPDYNRSYDRYVQRFDPGFGFNPGPYAIQPMYTPAMNYNTEFPQLASTHRQQVSAEHQPHQVAQHLPWVPPSNIAGIGYAHPQTMMTMYPPNHVSTRPNPSIYMHSSQYHGQHPAMPYIHSHEHIHRPFQSLQQQHGATLGLARPR